MNDARVIGIDVGGTKILSGVVERGGAIVRRRERPTPLESEQALLAGIEAAFEELRDDSVAAVGFGIPSRIDQRAGIAVGSVNIPLAGVAFRDVMRERLGLPVGIDNDGNAAAIAEWAVGAGRGTSDMLMLTLGTGVGGGLILAGKPYRGAIGAGAELGHIVIVHDGKPCACGGFGHLESYVSGHAADEVSREAFGPEADAYLLVRVAQGGDAKAAALLAEIGRKLGSGIASLVNVFDPEVVVVGGGFGGAAGERLLGPAREVVARETLSPSRELVRIVPAELGPEAGVVGAALVGFEALDGA